MERIVRNIHIQSAIAWLVNLDGIVSKKIEFTFSDISKSYLEAVV